MVGKKKILIASDHAGFVLKEEIQKLLVEYEWVDMGPMTDGRVDYPDYAEKLASRIGRGEFDLGILVCGSGIGMSIAANKIAGVRAAVVENPVSARLAREHNDANVLCLGSRFLAPEYGAEIARTWLEASFSTDGRHQTRLKKIAELEKR